MHNGQDSNLTVTKPEESTTLLASQKKQVTNPYTKGNEQQDFTGYQSNTTFGPQEGFGNEQPSDSHPSCCVKLAPARDFVYKALIFVALFGLGGLKSGFENSEEPGWAKTLLTYTFPLLGAAEGLQTLDKTFNAEKNSWKQGNDALSQGDMLTAFIKYADTTTIGTNILGASGCIKASKFLWGQAPKDTAASDFIFAFLLMALANTAKAPLLFMRTLRTLFRGGENKGKEALGDVVKLVLALGNILTFTLAAFGLYTGVEGKWDLSNLSKKLPQTTFVFIAAVVMLINAAIYFIHDSAKVCGPACTKKIAHGVDNADEYGEIDYYADGEDEDENNSYQQQTI